MDGLLPAGLEVAESAGETDAPLESRRLEPEPDPEALELLVAEGEVDKAEPTPGLSVPPGGSLMTPAAIPPLTGTKTACGGRGTGADAVTDA